MNVHMHAVWTINVSRACMDVFNVFVACHPSLFLAADEHEGVPMCVLGEWTDGRVLRRFGTHWSGLHCGVFAPVLGKNLNFLDAG